MAPGRKKLSIKEGWNSFVISRDCQALLPSAYTYKLSFFHLKSNPLYEITVRWLS